MNKLVFDGCIDSDFEGFNDNMIFNMSNGTYWIQARYEYWYHYAYRPKATINYENGRYKLCVTGYRLCNTFYFRGIGSNLPFISNLWNTGGIFTVLPLFFYRIFLQLRYAIGIRWAANAGDCHAKG